jgi:two-component system C4-dicarboxylate transport sensor histidine kinase DctB
MGRSAKTPPYAVALLGAAAGIAYVAFDVFSEVRIGHGTLRGPLADAHRVIDHSLPVLVGALLGVCIHSVRIHARLKTAEEAASRADALRGRLQRVERDQAVWVLAAAVLHELNNPLHALVLLLDEASATGTDVPRRIELVERARAQADRALSRLRTLRSMRAVREPEFQPIALAQLIRSLADEIGSLVAEEGLVVRVDCDRAVRAHADPTYVRAILENLVDNSLHALRCRGHGCIAIQLGSERQRAVIRVCDDGPALDSGVRASLFEPLGTAKAQGLGLGLPIARALARAMRGDLVFEDACGKAFRLDLPLDQDPCG